MIWTGKNGCTKYVYIHRKKKSHRSESHCASRYRDKPKMCQTLEGDKHLLKKIKSQDRG